MGLFDFARDAGEKLREKAADFFSGDAQAAEVAQEEIQESVRKHDLPIEGVEVALEGDRAILRGKAASEEAREKAILVVGNTNGVAQVDDRIEVAEPGEPAQFYTVQKGDTLSKIAKQFYGNANKYPVIFEANRPMLSDPDKIYPGQALRIPKAKGD